MIERIFSSFRSATAYTCMAE